MFDSTGEGRGEGEERSGYKHTECLRFFYPIFVSYIRQIYDQKVKYFVQKQIEWQRRIKRIDNKITIFEFEKKKTK